MVRPHRGVCWWEGHLITGPTEKHSGLHYLWQSVMAKRSPTHPMGGSLALPPRGASGHVGHSLHGGDMELHKQLRC